MSGDIHTEKHAVMSRHGKHSEGVPRWVVLEPREEVGNTHEVSSRTTYLRSKRGSSRGTKRASAVVSIG